MSATTTTPTYAQLAERYTAAKAAYTAAASEIARTGKGDPARIRELADALELARAAVDGYPVAAAERAAEARTQMLADLDAQIARDLNTAALRAKEAALREALDAYLTEAARLTGIFAGCFTQMLGLGTAPGFGVTSSAYNSKIVTPSATYPRPNTSDELGRMVGEAWRGTMNGEPANFLK